MIEDFLFAPTVTVVKAKGQGKVQDTNPILTVVGMSPESTVKGQIRLNGAGSKLTGIGYRIRMTVINNKDAVEAAIETKQEITDADGNTRVIKKKDLNTYLKYWIAAGFPKRDVNGNIVQCVKSTTKEEKVALAKSLGIEFEKLTRSKLPREDDMIGMLMTSPYSKVEIGTTGVSLLGSDSEYWTILGGATADNKNLIFAINPTPVVHKLGVYGDITMYEIKFNREEEKKQARIKKA